MSPMETAPTVARPSVSARWRGLSALNRRRIVLGSLFAVALAARDLMLFMVASGMFALSEVTASSQARPAAS
jgi:hypothetical protein